MQAAEPRELGLLQAGNQPEDSACAPYFSLVWKPTMFNKRAQRIVLAQLHDRVGLPVGACGLVRPTGFIGPWRKVSRPRSAITSIGRQPSK